MVDALDSFRQRIEAAIQTFSDNPLMVDDGFLIGRVVSQPAFGQSG